MMYLTKLFTKLFKRFPNFFYFLFQSGLVSRLFSRLFINFIANSMPPRPRPLSLASPYTSWRSLTDKSFSGRHLPPEKYQDLPDVDKVAHLWRRGEREIPSIKSSMLFSFYAQWLTDSFLRTDLGCTKRNHSNHELDLCQIYGLDPDQTKALREKKDGLLKSQRLQKQGDEEFLPYLFDQDKIGNDPKKFAAQPQAFIHKDFAKLHDLKRLEAVLRNSDPENLRYYFATGLEHGNSSLGQTLLNTIWMREHNRIARMLRDSTALTDDDEIFEKARNINIVQYLRIIIRDYIRHISPIDVALDIVPGMAERKKWYRENWIAIEFNLLYRWHSMVPDEFQIGDQGFDQIELRAPDLLTKFGIEKLITAATQQKAGRIGLQNTHKMFFQPFKVGDTTYDSVMVRSLKMGRDAEIGRYVDYRKAFGLKPLKRFADLTGDSGPDEQRLRKKLDELYSGKDDLRKLEWHVGVFAEKAQEGRPFGDLMSRMVGYDAFTLALTNPLLSQQVYTDDTFTQQGRQYLENTDTLGQVIRRNVARPNSVSASFTTPRAVPGSYGLPGLGVVIDTLDFLFISGWRRFFEKRKKYYNSSVFKSGFLIRSIVVLDKLGMEPFLNWNDGRLKKTFGFGWAAPPARLIGNTIPSIFTDGPAHDAFKRLYSAILTQNAPTLKSTFENVVYDHASGWEATSGQPMRSAIEDFAADFVFRWYLGESPDTADVKKVYLKIFKYKPAISLINSLGLYGGKAEYKRLTNFVRSSDRFKDYCELAKENMNLDDPEEILHQLLFVLGVNNFLGLQNIAKSIWAELSNNDCVANDIKKELIEAGASRLREAKFAALSSSKKLDNFLLEVLRKHPPVFFIFGTATQNFCLKTSTGVYRIDKGDKLTGVIPMVQMDPDVYDYPDDFRPDRFERGACPGNLVWPHASHTAAVKSDDHGCPGREHAFDFGRLFCSFLLLDCDWRMEKQIWSDRKLNLNVAAPKGDMVVNHFRLL